MVYLLLKVTQSNIKSYLFKMGVWLEVPSSCGDVILSEKKNKD